MQFGGEPGLRFHPIFKRLCMGFASDSERIEAHEFESDTPGYPMSHGLCPECKARYDQEVDKLKEEPRC